VSAAALSVNGAAQVLRPPEDGLPYLRHDRAEELRLEPGSLRCEAGLIAGFEPAPAAQVQIDASGCAVLPGLVDCHTHLPFAGWRAAEYEMKVRGVSYEEIARSGGGIRSSAKAFAEASDDAVLAQATALAGEMLQHGTTAFECKSGYGLSREGELRALRLAQLLGDRVAQATASTALLAHAVPDGFTADGWMDEVEAMLPGVVSDTAAQALDIYVESVAFTNDGLARMGRLAAASDLDLRAHVEQFNANRSVPVALAAGARSVDHLARLVPEDVEPLAQAECAAVLLPGAEFLGAEQVAPARALADAGAICALATDANPGTSPIVSLPLVTGLAARRYGWSVREALLAVTLNAAWVVRMSDERGSIETGKRADLVLLDGPADHVPYRFGRNPVELVVIAGEPAYVRPGSEWRLRG
jgi:imidazolonepropionase